MTLIAWIYASFLATGMIGIETADKASAISFHFISFWIFAQTGRHILEPLSEHSFKLKRPEKVVHSLNLLWLRKRKSRLEPATRLSLELLELLQTRSGCHCSKMCCHKSVGLDLTLMWIRSARKGLRSMNQDELLQQSHFISHPKLGHFISKSQMDLTEWWPCEMQASQLLSCWGWNRSPLHVGPWYWQKILNQQSGVASRGGIITCFES